MAKIDENALNNVRRKIGEVMKRDSAKTVFSQYTTTQESRKEGETWEDADGKCWIMKNGIRQSVSKLQDAKRPWFCPQCTKMMNHRHDDRYYNLRGMCYNCVIQEETNLRLAGTWEKVAEYRARANERAFLMDKIAESEDWIRTFVTPKNYMSDGRFEELAPASVFEEQFAAVRADIEFMKKRLALINEYHIDEAPDVK
jgi:hypothetical protein